MERKKTKLERMVSQQRGKEERKEDEENENDYLSKAQEYVESWSVDEHELRIRSDLVN